MSPMGPVAHLSFCGVHMRVKLRKRYKTIVADPPWKERGGGAKYKRGADRHYKLLSVDEIIRVMVTDDVWRPDKQAHLYLWVTNNFLQSGLVVMQALGFTYKTNIVWVKDRFGIGRYFRGQHELCLFGVRGTYMATMENSLPTRVDAPRTKHSQKPDEFYELVERASPGPRVEFFARCERDGWDAMGDQI